MHGHIGAWHGSSGSATEHGGISDAAGTNPRASTANPFRRGMQDGLMLDAAKISCQMSGSGEGSPSNKGFVERIANFKNETERLTFQAESAITKDRVVAPGPES